MDKKLNHIINNGTFYLYYDNTLLLKNGKSMPFIVLKKFVNGVESDLGLYEYTFQEKIGWYEFIFTKEEISVKVSVKEEDEGKLKFSFKEVYIGEYDEMCITLWKENEDKVYGLPTFKNKESKIKCKWLREKVENCKCEYIHKKFAVDPVYPEQKLSFYLSGKYFFENVNLVKNYVLAITDKIYFTVDGGKFDFRLRFCENMEELYASSDIDNYKVKKYPYGSVFLRMNSVNVDLIDNYLQNDTEKKIKGVMLEYKEFNLARIMTETKKLHDRKLDAIFIVNKKISELHAEKYFEGENYKETPSGEYKAQLNNQTGVRNYMVTVRKLLDTGIDGVYFDDDYTKEEITAIHHQIKTVAQEYPQISLFHTHLSEDNDDFGYYIIREEKVIEKMKNLRTYFFYSGECYIGKEEKTYTIDPNFDISIIKID